jgi:predicted  nucleic acid-binding Zn-ribbon protein
MTTKCPKCGEVVTGVSVKEVRGCALGGRVWQCVSLNCSRCETSLGVQIDPLAIKAALVDEIRAKI